MTDPRSPDSPVSEAALALLPAGLRDLLPPDAAQEAEGVTRLMEAFAAHGYERVKPPLIEFEDSLLAGPGAATSSNTFRVLDPASRRMMGVRADMTIQVARIATTRLTHSPRPLRLCYAGQVLQVHGSQLRPDRQYTQAGLELIGSDSPTADAEVIALTAKTLAALGIQGVSVDLSLPTLVPTLCDALDLSQERRARLRAMLDQKDVAAVRSLGGEAADLFSTLIACNGEALEVLDRLDRLDLPTAAASRRDRLGEVVHLVRAAAPEVSLTLDAVENRGFEYHTGISFSLFAKGARGELGRGGRYRAGAVREKAVGASLFVDALVALLPPPKEARRLFLPFGREAEGSRWRAEGWVTVAALDPHGEALAEARRLACSHVLIDGQPCPADV